MALSLGELKGMTAGVKQKLNGMGLYDAEAFLAKVKTPKDRQEMAAALNVGDKTVLELANRADLSRIVGVGEVYSDLLENAGVDTVKELAVRVPANLHTTLAEVAGKNNVRVPAMSFVENWVKQAKKLPKLLEY